MMKKNAEAPKQIYLKKLLNDELNFVFQSLGLRVIDNAVVSITDIKISPDLLDVKVSISIFPQQQQGPVFNKIQQMQWDIKKKLAEQIRNKVRRIPQITYLVDDALENMFQLEKLFQSISS